MPTSDAAAFNSIGKGNGASLDIDLNVVYERTSEDGVITVLLPSRTCETILYKPHGSIAAQYKSIALLKSY